MKYNPVPVCLYLLYLLLLPFASMTMAQNPVIAFYPFNYTPDISPKEESQIRKAFQDEFSKNTRFVVIENNFAEMMLKEQGLTTFPVCEENVCFAKMGELLVANLLTAGNVVRKKNTIYLELVVIDVASKKDLYKKNYSIKSESIDEVYVYSCIAANDVADNLLLLKSGIQTPELTTAAISVKKKKSRKAITWISLSSALIGGGAAAYFLYSNKDDDKSLSNKTPVVPLDDAPSRP